MSTFMAVLVSLLIFLIIPALLVILIVRLIKKKPCKKLVISVVICLCLIIPFSFIGALSDPATWCEHKYEVTQEVAPTCTKKGYTIKTCSLCGREKKEKIDKTEHNYEITKEVSATEKEKGYIIKTCTVCGKEEKEVLNKIKATSEPNNAESQTTAETQKATDKNSDAFKADSKVEGELPKIESDVTEALMSAGYSAEQASEMQKIFNTLGINSIEIENMTGEAQKGLNAVVCYPNGYTDRNKRFSFTTEDGVLFYAGYKGEDLYDADQGGYLKSYDDVYVPETKVDMETYTKLQALAETEVKKYLNHPDTADFDLLSWGVGRSDDKYKIIGSLKAQNSLGAEDDVLFGVWFEKQGDSFKVTGVTLNGQRVK